MKVWNLRFSLLIIIFFCNFVATSTQGLSNKIFNNGMGELLSASGKISITGDRNTEEKTDRVIFQSSNIHLAKNSFAHFYFRTGMYLKSRGEARFSVRKLKAMPIISLQLSDGELLISSPRSKNDSSIGKWQTEVVTPLGIVTVNHGDALISLSAKEQLLRVYSTDGKALFQLDSLQMSITPGEKVVVRDYKVKPKSDIVGSENRMLYSWYRQGGLWRIPPYLNQFSKMGEDKPVALKSFLINGLNREEFINHQTFSPSDLILGRLRIEGSLDNRLPHQVLQISLNNGRDYYDVESSDKFVLKVKPKEGHYQLRFRLRDLQRYYEIVHDDINFYYQRKGNQQIIAEWMKQVQNLYLAKDVFQLAKVFEYCETLPKSLREDLTQEFFRATFQRLHLSLVRYREYDDKIVTNFKYKTVRTLLSNNEPLIDQGRFEVIFLKDGELGVYARQMSGRLPFLNNLRNKRQDSNGPRVLGPSILQIQQFGNTSLSLQVQDDLSNLRRIEFFVDEIGRDGTGQDVLPLDGSFDERIEDAQIIFNNNFNGLRLFVHAQDESGNWGNFFSVSLSR